MFLVCVLIVYADVLTGNASVVFDDMKLSIEMQQFVRVCTSKQIADRPSLNTCRHTIEQLLTVELVVSNVVIIMKHI